MEDSEGTEILAYYAREGGAKGLDAYYSVDNIVNKQIDSKKNEYFLMKHGYLGNNKPEIVCFGAGNAFERNINKIKALYDVKYVCDNNESKWGKKICGVTCISPQTLQAIDNVLVILILKNKKNAMQIQEQLDGMGIDYDYMDRWF